MLKVKVTIDELYFFFFLSPVTKLAQGYIFTGVWDTTPHWQGRPHGKETPPPGKHSSLIFTKYDLHRNNIALRVPTAEYRNFLGESASISLTAAVDLRTHYCYTIVTTTTLHQEESSTLINVHSHVTSAFCILSVAV